MIKFLDPKNDFAFKRIFGNREHKRVLISFLDATLGLSADYEVVEVEILNPYQVPRLEELKETLLDVRATDIQGREFIVEMQVERQPHFGKRALYYSAKSYSGQLTKGTDYDKLRKVYFIGVLDFKALKNERYLSTHLILSKGDYEHYLQDFEFSFIELPKFNKHESELKGIVDKWIYFLKNLGSEGSESQDFERLFADDPVLLEALKTARVHALSKRELDAYTYFEDQRRIQRTDIRVALEEGRAEGERMGLEKGERMGLARAVAALVKQGSSTKQIATILELSETEVERLLRII